MIELALKAGRKRQSAVTGFVHLGDTIPIVENVGFALALLSSRTTENFLEGKEILQRVLHFQAESGNFPIYLHQYPQCDDYATAGRLIAPFHWILHDFGKMLGDLKPRLETAYAKVKEQKTYVPRNLADMLIGEQLVGKPLTQVPWLYSSYAGPAVYERQDGLEPEVTLLDLFLGSWTGTFSKRSLEDHDCHLLAALIRPIEQPYVETGSAVSFALDPVAEHLTRWHSPYKRIWGSSDRLHSLVMQAGNIQSLSGDERSLLVTYGAPIDDDHRQKQRELCFFLDRQPLKTWVNGLRANTFHVGDTVILETESAKIQMKFEVEGSGDFLGHVMLGNRPSQISTDKFEAYDWQIFLRTIRRSEKCGVRVSLDFS